jgi:exopolysaccharide production repressor protein
MWWTEIYTVGGVASAALAQHCGGIATRRSGQAQGEASNETQPKMRARVSELSASRMMSVPKFAIGMLFVVIVVVVWSVLDSASWTTVLLRAVICAVILQFGYFLIVLAMVGRERRTAARSGAAAPAAKPETSGKVRESNL